MISLQPTRRSSVRFLGDMTFTMKYGLERGTKYYNVMFFCLYYCQSDQADNEFENFCGEFLKDMSLKKLKVEEPAAGRIFLVLELPLKNRQNNVDVLTSDIEYITRKHLLEDWKSGGKVLDLKKWSKETESTFKGVNVPVRRPKRNHEVKVVHD
uniref:Uncharacterized protein n=1 Tax=Magallana gigas TaxID=29159 RepID=K1QWB3_MAGGI